jgi:IMP dehydrogenase
MEHIKEALTFDDVLIEPKYSEILPAETNLVQKISKKITLNLPFLSAAMDTVTEGKMAMTMAGLGGLGIIHRNFKIEDQIREVKKVKKKNLLVGAAVGTSQENLLRAKKLLDSGVDIIVVDTAHGHSKKVLNIVEKIKRLSSQVPLCAGNIATGQAALKLYNAGSDILKVGIGPGSICTTRMVAGIGVPQITAIMNVKGALGKRKIKIISDGGIKFSGDLVKALAAGADAVMMGSIFAGTEESPGQKFKIKNKFFKTYRGMGSRGAM